MLITMVTYVLPEMAVDLTLSEIDCKVVELFILCSLEMTTIRVVFLASYLPIPYVTMILSGVKM